MDIDYYKEQLNAKEQMLEQTTRFLISTQELLEEKNKDLQTINRDIFDSIKFASIIQRSLLPDPGILKVFFKDAAYRVNQQIGIGGDNVFVKNTSNGVMFGLLDSTGHGIPAALLSISGTVIMKELIYSMEINNPKPLFELLNQQMHNIFNNTGDYKIAQMEGIVFHYLSAENKLTYCSARGRAMHVKHTGEVRSLEATKRSIGEEQATVFSLFEVQVSPGDKLVLYSDGLQDQFGGSENKKFSSARLKKRMEAGIGENATSLAKAIEHEFKSWMGENSQTDDMSFIIIDF